MLSLTEENYLKAIYHLSDSGRIEVATNTIAEQMNTKPASVSDMIKKLAQKNLLLYEKYKGVNVSPHGKNMALQIIRKHRLWEVFLVEKLHFHWDEVHDVAEQLEHIQSTLLIKRLDAFLNYPRFDPHGDPIPDENGNLKEVVQLPLEDMPIGVLCRLMAVNDSNSAFLKYLDKIGVQLGATICVLERIEFDGSHEISIEEGEPIYISQQAARNLLVTEK